VHQADHIYWDEYSETSDSSKESHCEPKHSRRKMAHLRKENHARSISAPPPDEEEIFVQEIPEAALVAAQAHLLTTQPKLGDPREHMHQAAIKSLGLVGDELNRNPRRRSRHTRSIREEAEDTNLRKAKKPICPARQTMKREQRTQEILSHMPA
jgi:hypothetical protein